MVSAIGSSTPVNNNAQIATLEKQLVKDQKELQQLQTPGSSPAQAALAQVVGAQMTMVEMEIAQLSSVGNLSAESAGQSLGQLVNVTA